MCEKIRKAESLGVDFELTAVQDEIPVRGNAMASGDDEFDRKVEDEIIERLDRGDIWAWASVTVTARYNGHVGRDSLGCCSYADEDDFCRPGGYFDDMQLEALNDLLAELESAAISSGALDGLRY